MGKGLEVLRDVHGRCERCGEEGSGRGEMRWYTVIHDYDLKLYGNVKSFTLHRISICLPASHLAL
jgi:hypothetical protein